MARSFIAIAMILLVQHCVVGAPDATGTASCFGTKPDLDKPCSAFNAQAACGQQFGCIWTNPSKLQCFAKLEMSQLDSLCKKFENATECASQVACVWRSQFDGREVISSIRKDIPVSPEDEAAIKAGKVEAVIDANVSHLGVPDTFKLGTPTFASAHDHTQVGREDLNATVKTWFKKFHLQPFRVQDLVNAVWASTEAESTDYKPMFFNHTKLQGTPTVLAWLSVSCRNLGGEISMAFVYARVKADSPELTGNVKAKKAEEDDIAVRLHYWNAEKIFAELVLLEDVVLHRAQTSLVFV